MQTGRSRCGQSVPCYPAPTCSAPTYAKTWRNNWKMWEKPKAGATSSNETAAANSNQTMVAGDAARSCAARQTPAPRRCTSPSATRLWCSTAAATPRTACMAASTASNCMPAEPRAHRAERRLDRERHPEADLGRADLPVRPCAAQHAEGEIILAPSWPPLEAGRPRQARP